MTTAKLTLLGDEPLGTISPLVHGHFAEHLGRCCYDGLWVGKNSAIPNEGGFRTDVLDALSSLTIPMLRWPGGCFADTYHWRDGIGAPETRPRTLAESCGLNVVEDNSIGTHEFMALCKRIGAEPYLAANVGTGTPQEMMDWVDYCNGTADTTLARERAQNGHPDPMNVRYWGVGNENWGCGGNYDARDYGKEYKRYATFLRQVQNKTPLELIACGDMRREWNIGVVEALQGHISLLDHLSVHRYWKAGHVTDFTDEEYYLAMCGANMVDADIAHTDDLLKFFAAGRRKIGIAFDEWGIWHPEAASTCDYEAPSTQRDAVCAAGVLDVFHKWSDEVTMANIAQIVNVIHCLIQTREDTMWLTPTYHVFKLYTPHQGNKSLRVRVDECPAYEVAKGHQKEWETKSLALVSASASRKDGQAVLSLSNRHKTDPMDVEVSLRGLNVTGGTLLTLATDAPNAVNTAQQPERVAVKETTLAAPGDTLRLTLPPCSVQTALLNLG